MLGIFGILAPPDRLFRVSMAFAYTALVMLAATMVVGPLNVLRSRPNPVSTYLRRDIGIWAGLLALGHVVFGLQVHLRGRMRLYFMYGADEPHLFPVRHDLFGLANYTGLAVTVALLLLLTLSNNALLRKLGPRRWKRLQRWNYGAFALIVVHGIAYQVIERREFLFVGFGFVIVLAVVSLQMAGLRRVIR